MEDTMSDYARLGELALQIKERFISERKLAWKDSPFSFLIPEVSIKESGGFGEALLAMYATELGYAVTPHSNPNDFYDMDIDGKRIEVKFATQGKDGGFVANQIRNQAYDYVIVFALTPVDVIYWLFTKQQAWELGSEQHGTDEDKDTKILALKPKNKRKNKFSDYQVGNSLDAVIARMK